MNNDVIDVTPEMVSEPAVVNGVAEDIAHIDPAIVTNLCAIGETCDLVLSMVGIKIPTSRYVHFEGSNQPFLPLKDLAEQCGLESDRLGINNQSAIISGRIVKDSKVREVPHEQGTRFKEQGTGAEFKVVAGNDCYLLMLLPKQAKTTKLTKTEPGYYVNLPTAYDFVMRGPTKKCFEFRSEVCQSMLHQFKEKFFK